MKWVGLLALLGFLSSADASWFPWCKRKHVQVEPTAPPPRELASNPSSPEPSYPAPQLETIPDAINFFARFYKGFRRFEEDLMCCGWATELVNGVIAKHGKGGLQAFRGSAQVYSNYLAHPPKTREQARERMKYFELYSLWKTEIESTPSLNWHSESDLLADLYNYKQYGKAYDPAAKAFLDSKKAVLDTLTEEPPYRGWGHSIPVLHDVKSGLYGIIDLTADQFGNVERMVGPVVKRQEDFAAYGYRMEAVRPFLPEDTEAALPRLSPEIAKIMQLIPN